MPLLDGATTSLDADKWSELLGESEPSKFRGEARARHRSGPDAWDRACLRAESSFRADVDEDVERAVGARDGRVEGPDLAGVVDEDAEDGDKALNLRSVTNGSHVSVDKHSADTGDDSRSRVLLFTIPGVF